MHTSYCFPTYKLTKILNIGTPTTVELAALGRGTLNPFFYLAVGRRKEQERSGGVVI
jgi:hypothetical protein